MTAYLEHFGFEFRSGLRNRSLLLLNYIFPLFFYLMMGVMMGSINPPFIKTIIPAMTVFAVLSAAILGLPNPLVDAREAGIFRSYKINGVPAAAILSMPALTTAFHAVITAVIITATAPALFEAPPPVDWPAFAAVVLVTAFTCAGLGSLIGVVSANSRIVLMLSQFIYLPSMMLSGMMVPISILPSDLAKLSALLPPTYAMQALQGLAYREATTFDPVWSLVILAAGGALAFALAIYLFNWDSRNATRRGHPALALLALVPYLAGLLFIA